MNLIKSFFFLVAISMIVASCSRNDELLIEKGSVGKLTKNTKISELSTIFSKDSLVVNLSEVSLSKDEENKYFKEDDSYLVYDKTGKHLLTITPLKQQDSLSTIKSIEIFHNQYKTKKGISLYSPYKDIQTAYQISITNTLLSAHIDIDELNATMTIDKKEIGINEFNRDKINADQIPDLARIKHFTIWFN